jgi:protein-S-isoprenylcysteine O-methyltransferase Ste14
MSFSICLELHRHRQTPYDGDLAICQAVAKMTTTEPLDIPGVVMRPPLLFLGLAVAAIGLDAVWPWPLIPASMQIMGGGVLIVMALSLLGASLARFRRAGTHVETWKPSSALVTSGPYRVTRNPIYIAFLLMFGGLACALDNPWFLVLMPVLAAVLDIGVIRREERYLDAKFGEAYRTYCRNVRRWF